MLLLTLFMFLFMHNIPQKLFSKLKLHRLNRRSDLQSRRHFVHGAQLLSQARSSSSPADRSSILHQAVAEADKATALDPRDAAAHILKALILELQGFNTSAIDSLDAALSPLAVKSLSDGERADALCKRAELRLRLDRVDTAVDDLVESVRLKREESGRAFRLLGECYEKKGLKEKARKAYEDGLEVQPDFLPARQALDRLLSS
ncbi:hypothetical protein ACJIZ3_019186 [Penstemon smallii]|uniref:Uncharacterized protein n=1 Tax=Penstemon smallii TaxID=265156 RepID=A0ABD3T0G7_9LAMI